MAMYIIKWGVGFDTTTDVIEADNEQEAQDIAYELCREEFESNASYTAEPATVSALVNDGRDPLDYDIPVTLEDCEENGLYPEDYGLES